MEHKLENTVALLSRTPASLDALLRGLPEDWTMRTEGEGTWTVQGVVAHLIHCERNNWMPRIKWLLEFGESKSFVPFERESLRDEPPDLLLDEFRSTRSASLSQLHDLHLTQDQLGLYGLHPAFGRVTLSQQLATWATHDMTHLHQISRIMAHQYREAVGPWVKYLGVLQCSGHSGH